MNFSEDKIYSNEARFETALQSSIHGWKYQSTDSFGWTWHGPSSVKSLSFSKDSNAL